MKLRGNEKTGKHLNIRRMRLITIAMIAALLVAMTPGVTLGQDENAVAQNNKAAETAQEASGNGEDAAQGSKANNANDDSGSEASDKNDSASKSIDKNEADSEKQAESGGEAKAKKDIKAQAEVGDTVNCNIPVSVHYYQGYNIGAEGVIFDVYAGPAGTEKVGETSPSDSDGWAVLSSFKVVDNMESLIFRPRASTLPRGLEAYGFADIYDILDRMKVSGSVGRGFGGTNTLLLNHHLYLDRKGNLNTDSNAIENGEEVFGYEEGSGDSASTAYVLAFVLYENLGKIKVVKTSTGDIIDKGPVPLAGAKFQLKWYHWKKGVILGKEYNYGDVIDGIELVTDENGEAETPAILPTGEYELVEVEAPAGYKINTNPHRGIEISGSQTVTVNVTDEKTDVGRISFQKVTGGTKTDSKYKFTISLTDADGNPFNGSLPYVHTKGTGGLALQESNATPYHATEEELQGKPYVIIEADPDDPYFNTGRYYGTGNLYIFRSDEEYEPTGGWTGVYTTVNLDTDDDGEKESVFGYVIDYEEKIEKSRPTGGSVGDNNIAKRFYVENPKGGYPLEHDNGETLIKIKHIAVLDAIQPISMRWWNLPAGSEISKVDTSKVVTINRAVSDGAGIDASNWDISSIQHMRDVVDWKLLQGLDNNTLDLSDYDASNKTQAEYNTQTYDYRNDPSYDSNNSYSPWIEQLFLQNEANASYSNTVYSRYESRLTDTFNEGYNKIIINDTFTTAPEYSDWYGYSWRGQQREGMSPRYWVHEETGRLMTESPTPGGTYVPEEISDKTITFVDGKAEVMLGSDEYFALQLVPDGTKYTIEEEPSSMWKGSAENKSEYRSGTASGLSVSGSIETASKAIYREVYDTHIVQKAIFTNTAVYKDYDFKKVDESGKPLAGATVVIKDHAGDVVEQWETSSEEEVHAVSLGSGSYVYEEISAPDGYEIAKPIAFVIDNNGKMLVGGKETSGALEMVDTKTGVETTKETPKEKSPGISISKGVDKKKAAEGDILTYAILVSNTGDTAIKDHKVWDALPAETLYRSDDSKGKYSVKDGNEVITWIIDELAPGESKTIYLTAKVKECRKGDEIKNIVYTDGLNEDEDTLSAEAITKAKSSDSLVSAVDTGDNDSIFIALSLIAMSAAGLAAMLYRRRKKEL